MFTCVAIAACAAIAACGDNDDELLGVAFDDEQLLVASNTSGTLVKIQTDDLGEPDREDITVPYADGDGIGLRGGDLFATNRSDNRLLLLDDVFDEDNEAEVAVVDTFPGDITNQRGVAVDRELGGVNVAVASAGSAANGDINRIYRFRASGSDIALEATVTVPFALWGLEWDGSTLLAVKDLSDSVAVFEGFDQAQDSDLLQPTYYFRVEGLTRTHGITFARDDDVLILTDIGAAGGPGSDADGAFHFVREWRGTARSAAKTTGVLGLDRQVRVAGAATLLGNPVDVAYDDDNNRVYIAERVNGGGRLLAFETPTADGSPAPVFNETVAGASSVEYRD